MVLSRDTWLSKRELSLALLLALAPAIVKIVCYPRYMGSDDSYIHLQVVHTLLTSGTWGIAPGLRCNLSTSPLYTLLLLAATQSLLRTHVVIAMQALSCIATTAGLLAIFYRIYRSTKGNRLAAFLGLGSAALSCNLWRWNGTLMETSLAFCAVAIVLLLCSSDERTRYANMSLGALLGFSILLRPEFCGLALLCVIFVVLTSRSGERMASFASILPGTVLPVACWLCFSYRYFHGLLPTTFYVKTTHHLILWNTLDMEEYTKFVAYSFLWPGLLLVVSAFASRRKRGLTLRLLFPVCGCFFYAVFFYLFTDGLQSVGRYLLPYFPLLCVAAAEFFAYAMQERPVWPWKRLVLVTLVLHGAMSLAINARMITPVLNAFQQQYFAAMQGAAEYLASHNPPDRPVLVEIDIGVLSYCDGGRFRIADGGGLASPELANRPVDEQMALVHPALVLQSQGKRVDEWAGPYGNLIPLWHTAYRGHGVNTASDTLFANIYATGIQAKADPVTAR